MANIVAIVGRPNVGKSTLFNRLVGFKKAIMDNEIGITRDRHYGYGEWIGKHYTVIDTGGFVREDDSVFNESIRQQIQIAIEESDIILFMVDCHMGVTDFDKDFANVVRKSKKPVLLVANKADDNIKIHGASEFYSMGLGEVFPISSQSGSGTGELLDELVSHFKEDGEEGLDDGIPKIAILGKPNVGKSSLLNVLTGKERSIVNPLAGTTRDAINTRYNMFGQDFILVDTAGIRKKSKVTDNIEFYSVLRSIRALEESDVCIIMADAQDGLESQDLNILRLAQRNRKGIVILMNKWDLIEKDSHTATDAEKVLREKLAPHHYIPIIFTSVVEKQRIHKAVEKAVEVYNNKVLKIPTSKLNDIMLAEIERNPPPALKGKYIKIKYVTQLPTHNPTFAFFCNLPQYIKEPYERFLENKLRSHFPFEGVPISIVFRKK